VWQDFSTDLLKKATDLADEYILLGGKGTPDSYKEYKSFFSNLKVTFLRRLAIR